MTVVRFAWDPHLVAVRREACPRARWDKTARAWAMTAADAERFIEAAHARLDLARRNSQIIVDEECWIVGFVRGAPCRKAAQGP
jgi:hypothetical protein